MPEFHVYKPVLVLKGKKLGMQEAVDKLSKDGWKVDALGYELESYCDKCMKQIRNYPEYDGDKCYHKKCFKAVNKKTDVSKEIE